MKLSISNLGWREQDNQMVYDLMEKYGFTGLEIAPTKILPQNPYDNLSEIKTWKENLQARYNFEIPSMQAVLYKRPEQLFKNKEERDFLFGYLQKVVDFANAINCRNIVFGCAKNRSINKTSDIDTAKDFFRKIGDYACSKNTAIGFEAVPAANTNFINDTKSAVNFIREVNSKGLLLNLDTGTMITNTETLDVLNDNFDLINHVHLSEPNLENLKERTMYKDLITLLRKNNYNKFISVEIKEQNNISDIEKALSYVRGLL